MRRETCHWVAAAFAGEAVIAASVLYQAGSGERGTDIALQATARVSFLLFWLAYTGAALASLAPRRLSAVPRNGRTLGLAFAAAQSVHVGLVAWLCCIGKAPDAGVFVFFGSALFWVVCLVVFSFRDWRSAANGWPWWVVRRLGMTWIAFAFAVDFWRHPLQGGTKQIILYLPFEILSAAGPVLVVGHQAWKGGWWGRHAPTSLLPTPHRQSNSLT